MDAAAWDERYQSADLVWGAEPNIFVKQICADLHPGTALDLACGEGRNALWLARQDWDVSATDFSSVAIARARTLAAGEPDDVRRRLTWEVADVTKQDLGDSRYDLVLLSYLHLAWADMHSTLRRAISAVRPDGLLVSVGHDRRNLTEGVGGPPDPEILHVPGTLRAALERLPGIVVERAETTSRETANGTALDCVVVAHRVREAQPAPE